MLKMILFMVCVGNIIYSISQTQYVLNEIKFVNCENIEMQKITINFVKNMYNLNEFDIYLNDSFNYKINAVFDPGASVVTFNESFLQQLLQNKIINKSKVIGNKTIKLGNGSVIFGKSILIDKINLSKKYSVSYIEGIVLAGGNSPLLLGQSFFETFGKITIDNQNKTISLTPYYTDYIKLAEIIKESDLFSNFKTTVEPKLPPQKARDRIEKGVCIRFFHPDDKIKAEAIKLIFEKFKISKNKIIVENMALPPYNYKSTFPNYIEIWLKE